MTSGVLQAKGLCKSYKDKQVLKNLDITIEPGKIYGLIGRNGAGKTTLLGILTAQNTHDSGEVTYGGEPVWENPKALAAWLWVSRPWASSREIPRAPAG